MTSEDTARRIDAEIHRLIEENLSRARTILVEHKREMELLAQALLEVESVDEADIRKVFETGEMPKRKEGPAMPEPVADAAPVVGGGAKHEYGWSRDDAVRG